jgi:hypothetical protein
MWRNPWLWIAALVASLILDLIGPVWLAIATFALISVVGLAARLGSPTGRLRRRQKTAVSALSLEAPSTFQMAEEAIADIGTSVAQASHRLDETISDSGAVYLRLEPSAA